MSRELRQLPREPRSRDDVILVSPKDDLGFSPELTDDRLSRERRLDQMRLFWSYRMFLAKALGYGLLVSFIVAWIIPSRYESTAHLMPPDQQMGSGLASVLASAVGRGTEGGGTSAISGLAQDALGIKTSSDLFVGVLSSRTVQDDLIRKFNLHKVYWVRTWEAARKDLTNRTEISVDKKTGIISIKVEDRDPQRAAAMGREYIDQLNWVVTQLNTSSARRERVFLDQRLVEVKKDLEASEKSFSQFASQKAALDIPAQGKAMVEATAALEGQLIAAETELQGLKQIYTDTNIRVRSTQARIDELQLQIKKLGGTSSEVQDPDSIYPSIRQLPLLGLSYADLLRQTKVEEAVFETLTQQDELAKVDEAKSIPSVKVLDPPDLPEKKSFPPRGLITFLGGMVALMGALLWVFTSHRWRQIDPEDPTKAFALEVVNDVRSHYRILQAGQLPITRSQDQKER